MAARREPLPDKQLTIQEALFAVHKLGDFRGRVRALSLIHI